MADYDLVIRNGTIVDGTGMPGYRGDIGIIDDRIAHIGRISATGTNEIDADGLIVTPGFIDGHTHMDAQVCWDPMGTSSCWHGVTTAIMGNCGLTLAPVSDEQRDVIIRNLEGVEDIPGPAIEAGVPFTWEHFSDYLDHVDSLPKGINFAGYVGHTALRAWTMGERCFHEPANDEDIAKMSAELVKALEAGAVGFSTSRANTHITSDGKPVASLAASWDEVVALVETMASAGGGIFELANESVIASPDPEVRGEYAQRLQDLAVSTGVPTTFGVTGFGGPDRSRELLRVIDAVAAAGGRMFGQSLPMGMDAVYSFRTKLPFERQSEWAEWRQLPFDEQVARLRDPQERERLTSAAKAWYEDSEVGFFKPDYDEMRVMLSMTDENPTVGELARERGVDPAEVMVDLGLESDFNIFFNSLSANADDDEVQTIATHPRTVMTFTDSGAHVGQFIFTAMHTHLLANWVRERNLLTLEDAIRELTLVPASMWGFADRGLVREGFVADLNVIDPDTVGPELPEAVYDLPSGAVRLIQRSRGITATIVAGETVLLDGEHTGAYPGKLIRKSLAA